MPYKYCIFVDVDKDPCIERQFLKRFDFVAQRVEAVVFHAFRCRFQLFPAVRTYTVMRAL